MPLDQRYVVAAFDAEGKQLGFISPSSEWVEFARRAAIFQSQVDADYFIEKNKLCENADSGIPRPPNCDHVRAAYVRVEIKPDDPNYDHNNPDKGIRLSFSGMG